MAAAGYLTLTVDLFSDGGARRCLVSTMRSLASGQGRAFTDLATARQWLLESGRTTGKVGVIGFCMGGGFALLLAEDGFDAAAVNYGRLPKDPEFALAGACPIVANFGAKDRGLRGTAARLSKVLQALGTERDVKEFETAGHAFLNDEDAGPRPLRPLLRVLDIGPDPQSAPEAWRRIEDHFARHLKEQPNRAFGSVARWNWSVHRASALVPMQPTMTSVVFSGHDTVRSRPTALLSQHKVPGGPSVEFQHYACAANSHWPSG